MDDQKGVDHIFSAVLAGLEIIEEATKADVAKDNVPVLCVEESENRLHPVRGKVEASRSGGLGDGEEDTDRQHGQSNKGAHREHQLVGNCQQFGESGAAFQKDF